MGRGRGRVVALVVAAIVAAAGPMAPGGGRAAAQEVAAVQAWVEVGSVRPDVGCWVDTTVEVRGGGQAVAGVEVAVALAVEGEIVSLDGGLTDGDGIAWVGFETGAAAVGSGAWLDVTLDGAYAGGTQVVLTDGGACAGDGTLIELTGNVSLAAVPDVSDVIDTSAFAADAAGQSLSVPTYVQQRNLSCEYAALVIAMGAYGTWVSELDLDGRVGWSDNPHWGFRGDINGWWGNTDDYGVYPEALVPALADYGFAGEVFYGGDAGALTARLDRGEPTLVWLGLRGDTSFYETMADGTSYKLAAGYHVVVAAGYDAGGVTVSDPASGSIRYYDWDSFLAMWNVLDGMSLAVAPA